VKTDEESKNIYQLLHVVQMDLVAKKGQWNAFGSYNYRSCEDILEGVKSILKRINCIVLLSDSIETISDRIYVKSTAKFINCLNGDSIENTAFARESLTKKGMDDSQVTGATSSYSRKYALNGLFLVDDSKDSDTMNNCDKEKAEAEEQRTKEEADLKLKEHIQKGKERNGPLTEEQIEIACHKILDGDEKIFDQCQKYLITEDQISLLKVAKEQADNFLKI